eukprot:scaffold3357_cov57-Skeletonema_menzelii.AAC.1
MNMLVRAQAVGIFASCQEQGTLCALVGSSDRRHPDSKTQKRDVGGRTPDSLRTLTLARTSLQNSRQLARTSMVINIPKIGVYVRSCQYNECPGVPLLYQIERFQHVRVAVQTVEVRWSGVVGLSLS